MNIVSPKLWKMTLFLDLLKHELRTERANHILLLVYICEPRDREGGGSEK